jgi:dolichol-phosphate mannosyltransferase
MHRASDGLIPKDVADFRLIDRKIIDTLNGMPERNRFFRGLAAWSGFSSCGISFERGKRHGGHSKASTCVVISLALRGICSFSNAPLKLPLWLGIALTAPSFLALLWIGFHTLLHGWLPLTGIALIISLNLFLFGLVFIMMGLMGEYIGAIASEVRARPLYVIEKHLGLS